MREARSRRCDLMVALLAALVPALVVAGALTIPAQGPRRAEAPGKPPAPGSWDLPRSRWGATAWFFPAGRPRTFGLLIRPVGPVRLQVDARDVTLSVTSDHAPIPAGFHPEVQPGLPPIPQPPSDRDDPNVRWFTVTLPPGLGPDMYTLTGTVHVRATDEQAGEPVAVANAVGSIRFYSPPAPEREPSLSPGQAFLYLPETAGEMGDKAGNADLFTKDGRRVPFQELVLRKLTLQRVEALGNSRKRLWLFLEGHADPVSFETDATDPSSLPSLKPVLEDATVRRLRKAYAGKPLWERGGVGLECVTADPEDTASLSVAGNNPLIIWRLVRVRLSGLTMAIGGRVGVIGGIERPSDYAAYDPLVAVYEPPRKVFVTGGAFGGSGGLDAVGPNVNVAKGYIGAYGLFTDGWDFERTFSPEPFWKRPEWPRWAKRAVRNGEMRKGMTHDMVAWVLGWPGEYGNTADLRKSDAWRYDDLPPFNYWVHFKKGRVTDFGPDGTLP